MKYTIIDNFLTDEENDQIISYFETETIPVVDSWHLPNTFPLIERMISETGVKDYVGYEMHFNPGWRGYGNHFDKDEVLFNRTGELKYPLVSIVYYPIFEGIGGELILVNEGLLEIKPKRLIYFESTIEHGVNNFNGNRLSLGINPWHIIPESYIKQ